MDRRLVWAVLVGAVVAAAVLRLPFLGHQSLWLDETYTRDIIGEPTLGRLWSHVRATESTPPLFYVVAWLLGGRSAAEMRAVPTVALILAVPVAYLAFRRLVGQRSALAVAALLAVSPELSSCAFDARAYGLFVLTGLLSLWGYARAREHADLGALVLWVAGSVACVWTHYFGAFLVGAEALGLLLAAAEARRATLAAATAIAVCLIPLVPLLLDQSGDERAAFIAGRPLRTRLEDTVRQFAMGPNVPRTSLEAAGLALAALALAAGVWLALRDRGAGGGVVLGLATIAVGLPFVLALTGVEDRFFARNVVFAVPLLAALAAPALLALRGGPLALYLALCVLTSVWVGTDWRYEQPDWRGALARAQAIDPSAAVLAVTPRDAPVVRTYLGRAPVASVRAAAAWVIVEPSRPSGHRDLVPVPAPPTPAGFQLTRELVLHAFRLLYIQAPSPRPLALPASAAFPAR